MSQLSSAAEVAISADEYVLLHKGSFKYLSVTLEASGYGGNCVSALPLETRLKNLGSLCSKSKSDSSNYCHEKGHWKADCSKLKAKLKAMDVNIKPAAP